LFLSSPTVVPRFPFSFSFFQIYQSVALSPFGKVVTLFSQIIGCRTSRPEFLPPVTSLTVPPPNPIDPPFFPCPHEISPPRDELFGLDTQELAFGGTTRQLGLFWEFPFHFSFLVLPEPHSLQEHMCKPLVSSPRFTSALSLWTFF